ncbi:hypothetical protein [Mesorhizobium sp. M0276]|uniref:hypothetical protein n=1 Tax=Mesorhizobium sp. M0276 TaxID=2956928 RepID=UPI00333996A2
MTIAKPFDRYSAIENALASGFAAAKLHHLRGRDLRQLAATLLREKREQRGSILAAARVFAGRLTAFLRLFVAFVLIACTVASVRPLGRFCGLAVFEFRCHGFLLES